MRAPAVVVGLLSLAWVAAAPARADEAQRVEQATALVQRIVTLRQAADRPALDASLAQVAALHNALEDKAVRGRLQGAVGDVLAAEELGATRLLAADVLGELHDERVWTELKREWPDADLEAAMPLHLRVVTAAGRVAAPASATALLDLMKRGRDANLVRVSVEALARFGWAKNRIAVLQELGDTIPLTQGTGGGARGARVSPETAAAWQALRPTLLAALNELTGRTEATLDAWTVLLKENRRRLDSLFARERN